MPRDKQPFPIFAPVLGLRQDAPELLLEAAMHTDNTNVLVDNGEIHRAKKPVKEFVDGDLDAQAMPDGLEILHYHFLEKNDLTSYLCAFTADHIYHWDAVGKEWDLKHTCRETCTAWSTVTFNDQLIATNNGWLTGSPADRPLYWNGTNSLFQNLAETDEYSVGTVAINDESLTLTGTDTLWSANVSEDDRVFITGQTAPYVVDTVVGNTEITLTGAFDGDNITGKTYQIQSDHGPEYSAAIYIGYACFCVEHENYLILGYTQKGGNSCPQDIDWCALGVETNFLDGDSGTATLPNPHVLTGFGKYGDFLMIFKERTFSRMWLTATDLVFNIVKMSNTIGTYSPDSICNGADGGLFFYASDKTFRQVAGSTNGFPIVSKAIPELAREIPDDYVHLIRSLYIPRYRAVVWSIPSGADATSNNKTLMLTKDGSGYIWVTGDEGYSALGSYKPTAGYTIDTIPFDSIDEISWDTINMVEVQPGHRPVIAGDTDGKGWRLFSSILDGSSAYTGSFTLHLNPYPRSLDPRQAIAHYKRIHEIEFWFRREETGSLTISYKRDFESSWQTGGTVSLVSSAGEKFVRVRLTGLDWRCRTLLLKIAGATQFRFVGLIPWFTIEDGRRT